MQSKIPSKGVFYIATGSKYVEEARRSVETLRKVSNLPVAIASEIDCSGFCDSYLPVPSPHFSFRDKVENIGRSPFADTLFTDGDVSFFHDPSPVFEACGR